MKHLKNTFFGASIMAIVAVGVGVSASEQRESAPVTTTLDALDKYGVRSAQTCTSPMDVNYQTTLEEAESGRVQFAGCGGLL